MGLPLIKLGLSILTLYFYLIFFISKIIQIRYHRVLPWLMELLCIILTTSKTCINMDNFTKKVMLISQYSEYLEQQPYIDFLRILKPSVFKLLERQEDDNIQAIKTKVYYAKLAGQNMKDIIDSEILMCFKLLTEEKNIKLLQRANHTLNEEGIFRMEYSDSLKENRNLLENDLLGIEKNHQEVIISHLDSPVVQQNTSANIDISFEELIQLPLEEQVSIFKEGFSITQKEEALNEIFDYEIIKAWFLNKYFIRLTGESFDLEEFSNEETSDIQKIEWNGTQKELAELFVELHRKKWIDEIPTKLIKQYFTKSNTIEQVLKPTQDSKTKEKNYEGIYKKSYKPCFDTIRQNTKKQ